jgi:ATP-binding cassette subfamily F protein uup
MTAPNILLLDEPTNDLDVTTLAILEDYLQTFSGPILTVSHDRWFLDKLATSIFEVRDGGEIFHCVGNWSDWAELRQEEEKAENTVTEKPRSAAEKPREKKLKFTFKEQKEFETIDDDIAALEASIAECEEEMSRCGSDYVRLQQLTEHQEELTHQLEEKTERWIYLNELKEKIDAQDN